MSDLYNRIENLCKTRNETITSMCKASGASRASLSDLKVGRKQNLSAATLSKIASYLNVSVDYLIDGTGYGGGLASGSGFGDGTGYGGPILESETAYDRTNELCSLHNKVFIDVCLDAGLTKQNIQAWKEGTLPSEVALKKIATQLLVPVDFLLVQESKKAPTDNGERDILDEVDYAFYGAFKELTEDDKDTVRDMVMLMRQRRAEREGK